MKNKIIIIAEAGVNHNGDIDLAKKLIDIAAESGADFVKFQSFKLDKLVSKSARKADYQLKNTDEKETNQFQMLKKLILTIDSAKVLKGYCDKKKIKFLSTPFDIESIEELDREELVDVFKVPSGEIINLNYLKKLSSKNKPVFLSTGMASMSEISNALDILLESGNLKRKDITILHCNTEYPTPKKDVNLNAMLTIKNAFKVSVGYSDHSLGIEIPIAAAALGATVIEKHLTFNKKMEGPDHKASLEPNEFKSMVKAIRNIEIAMGNGIKKPSPSEEKNILIARKSLHLTKTLKKGHVISNDDIVARRPSSGISPMHVDLVIGRTLNKDIKEDNSLNWTDLY